MPRVHRRQFVLGPEPMPAHEDWVSRRLGPASWLSCCPELRVEWARDAEGAPWALVGHAVETRAELAEPAERIAASRTAGVPDLIDGWMGRWVLLGADQVQMDASARLGCFFGTAADGGCWVSSSPALLAGVLWPAGPPPADPRRLRYEVGVPWVPPPRSRYPGMARLLASQVLDPRTSSVRARPLLPPIDPGPGDEEIRGRIAEGYVTGLRRLAALADAPLLLGLSAGRDSRLVLAMARRAGIEVTCVTRIAPRTSLADRVLPPLLAARAGYAHRFLTARRGGRRSAAELVARHTAGHVSPGDAQPLVSGVRDALEGISIGGWVPIGNPYHYRSSLTDRVPDADAGARTVLRTFAEPRGTSAHTALREYFEWTLATPHPGLDWRDRLEIEQGSGGLVSAKEQLYDLNRLARVPLFNSRLAHSQVLSLSMEHRSGRGHQDALIRWAAPELLELPCNPPDRYFGRRRAAVRRVRHLGDSARRARASAIRSRRRLAWRLGR